MDIRDLRDPQKLGEALLNELEARRHEGSAPIAHLAADYLSSYSIPNYPQDESMAVLTAREYRAELEERKEAGDKYAASAIAALDKGGKVEYDDPSGE